MNDQTKIGLSLVAVAGVAFFFILNKVQNQPAGTDQLAHSARASQFEYLSQNGNSSCSLSFKNSILAMADDVRLQGSCCSPMDMHRYDEQVEGLKKYQNIPEIPPDPYDIEAGLAKKLLAYYDTELTPEEQKAYD